MNDEHEAPAERPKAFWKKVYLAVVINAFVVVTLLWIFSRYFR
ncbi:MAG: hypothetical protein ABIP78_08340 [Pyrinomonadaceae bacterium]